MPGFPYIRGWTFLRPDTGSESSLRGAKICRENVRGMKFCEKFVKGTKFWKASPSLWSFQR